MDSKFGSLSVAFFERLRGHMLTLPQRRIGHIAPFGIFCKKSGVFC
jgi:hypothetical protein